MSRRSYIAKARSNATKSVSICYNALLRILVHLALKDVNQVK